MSEKLAASEFLKSLEFKQLTTLYTESLMRHNTIALYVIVDELKRRKKSELIVELVAYAFRDGLEFKYNSGIAEALKLVMSDLKRTHPLALLLYNHLAKNETTDYVMDLNKYEKLLEKHTNYAYDNFCESLSPKDLAAIDKKLFNLLVTHYIDLSEPLGVEARTTQEEDSIRWYKGSERFAEHVKRQIEAIAKDDALYYSMNNEILLLLHIDQVREQ
jgi:hypothetical protein